MACVSMQISVGKSHRYSIAGSGALGSVAFVQVAPMTPHR